MLLLLHIPHGVALAQRRQGLVAGVCTTRGRWTRRHHVGEHLYPWNWEELTTMCLVYRFVHPAVYFTSSDDIRSRISEHSSKICRLHISRPELHRRHCYLQSRLGQHQQRPDHHRYHDRVNSCEHACRWLQNLEKWSEAGHQWRYPALTSGSKWRRKSRLSQGVLLKRVLLLVCQ